MSDTEQNNNSDDAAMPASENNPATPPKDDALPSDGLVMRTEEISERLEEIQQEETTNNPAEPPQAQNLAEPPAQIALATTDDPDMRRVEEIINRNIRAYGDALDDTATAAPSLYRIRTQELTEQLLTSPEAVAISRIAYLDKIDAIVRLNNFLQNAVLYIAQDLGVTFTQQVTDLRGGAIISQTVEVVGSGTYKTEQLMQIAVKARQKIVSLYADRNAATAREVVTQREVEKLRVDLKARSDTLEKLQQVPPPPMLDNQPYVLAYWDNKNRLNYLGKLGNSYLRTRRLADAERFDKPEDAGKVLLDVLRNTREHAIPKAHKLELLALHVIGQPNNKLSQELLGEIYEARSAAYRIEEEIRQNRGDKKRKKRKRNRQRERE